METITNDGVYWCMGLLGIIVVLCLFALWAEWQFQLQEEQDFD